ncbi:endonuclease/exonuclease/phosphatase family protein [Alienimonas chondri]|uniref:Endonuclease/exonuclease/phosphatase domain-containing protein n=1 Tax=Alienimonas chondri TaxID=2681879 RepID=A0ABX1VDD2_9PLAN|nr:endonuclease/exonuclease/phosphatase family protein [Alienimonas chondri]NNJ26113.1 hypothetical protein [Alienimonas chondri]
MPSSSRLPPLPDAPPAPRKAVPRFAAPADEPSPAEPKKSRWLKLRGGAFGTATLTLLAVVIAGVVLRFTVKDGFAPLAPAFYALSVPMLVVLSLAAALTGALALGLKLTFKRCLLIVALGVLGAMNAAIFLFQDATFDDRPRVVLWNTARGVAGWEGVADALEANNPTLAVLVESGEDEAAEAFWNERFGDRYFLARPGRGITILSRGPIGRVEPFELEGGGIAVSVKAQIDGQRVALLAVDLPANPFRDREAPLKRIAELADELAENRPTLVAGDFNTPPDSVHFGPLRRGGFVHAFERHGSGYAATWPVPAPALHVDHVWMSPGFDAGETWHGWTASSDHRPVLLPVRVAPQRFADYQAARALAAESRTDAPLNE